MSSIGLNLTNNYSLYAVPVAWAVAVAPHFYAIALYNSEKAAGSPKWDNTEPKKNIANIKDAKLSPASQGKYLRAEAAQQNGLQNLPLFAAAILAGNFARLSPSILNTTAAVYLLSRVVYSFIYINNTSELSANLRSATFLTGVATWMSLFVRAGNKLF
ncbi:hypothetical protein L486_00512 [Kwoniella mangroviensis CBS 10435]|uniref:Uncharacterized protein n=1 Tax=Kwoniella mangroviensis CBS 10435 TaxID=1331196 RepID=A0A1B9IZA9_9TREE|nr:uncharacterized protein I203_04046 [Kwoniella mangroviensis CBS 8507]OCF60868.1 hypothetical protein L486_00512 [Kwoniella mangroviensis CBS 10435]OCF66470.1 hypothetical protein I203_04046 [Kwoniella mangroviensis CBS 8507]OCF74382.1 hypothetical protein I204_04753 [Kwoniella mangroviensis CBS 8886]